MLFQASFKVILMKIIYREDSTFNCGMLIYSNSVYINHFRKEKKPNHLYILKHFSYHVYFNSCGDISWWHGSYHRKIYCPRMYTFSLGQDFKYSRILNFIHLITTTVITETVQCQNDNLNLWS